MRMAAILLGLCISGFDPSRFGSSLHCRRSFDVDSCCHLGAAGLGSLITCALRQYLVCVASDVSNDSAMTTATTYRSP